MIEIDIDINSVLMPRLILTVTVLIVFRPDNGKRTAEHAKKDYCSAPVFLMS